MCNLLDYNTRTFRTVRYNTKIFCRSEYLVPARLCDNDADVFARVNFGVPGPANGSYVHSNIPLRINFNEIYAIDFEPLPVLTVYYPSSLKSERWFKLHVSSTSQDACIGFSIAIA